MNRHVEALAEEFLGRGHHVRVLAPFDPPGRLSRVMHRADAEPRETPDYFVPLGRSIGFTSNGSISNLAAFPAGGVRRSPPRAPHGRIRRGPRPRAGGAAGRLERDARRPHAGGRHLPRLLDQGDPQPHRDGARRPARLQPALGPNRRLRGRRLDRAALVRRRLRDHPQRGRRRRRSEPAEAGERGAAGAVRRPSRGAQGVAGPARRVRRPGRARALPAHRDRGRARRHPPLSGRPRADALDRRRRAGLRRRSCGAPCTRPTSSARRRSRERASAWSLPRPSPPARR